MLNFEQWCEMTYYFWYILIRVGVMASFVGCLLYLMWNAEWFNRD